VYVGRKGEEICSRLIIKRIRCKSGRKRRRIIRDKEMGRDIKED
jgi:hypothetical protein